MNDEYKEIESINIAKNVTDIGLKLIETIKQNNSNGKKTFTKKTINNNIDMNVTTTFIQENENLVSKFNFLKTHKSI